MKIKGQDLTFSIPHAFQWELKKNIFFLCLIVCQELIFFFLILCVWVCVYVPQVIKATGWCLWEGDIVTHCFFLKSFIDAHYYVRGMSWYLLLVPINIWIAFWIFFNSYLHTWATDSANVFSCPDGSNGLNNLAEVKKEKSFWELCCKTIIFMNLSAVFHTLVYQQTFDLNYNIALYSLPVCLYCFQCFFIPFHIGHIGNRRFCKGS